MRPRRLPRYATIVTAAIGSLALVAAITAPASASAGRSHSSQGCNSVGALCWTRVDGVAIPREGPLPKGAPATAGTITVDLAKEFPHSKAARSIPDGQVLGYILCLYHAPKSCLGENRGEPGEVPPPDPSTHQVLAWIADQTGSSAVWATMVYLAKRSFDSWMFKVTGLYNAFLEVSIPDPQDGWCFQDWQDPGLDILASCNEDGDYYQFVNEGDDSEEIHDTMTGADTHTYCNCHGEIIIESDPVDWYTWAIWPITNGDTNSVTESPSYAKAMAAYTKAHHKKDVIKAG